MYYPEKTIKIYKNRKPRCGDWWRKFNNNIIKDDKWRLSHNLSLMFTKNTFNNLNSVWRHLVIEIMAILYISGIPRQPISFSCPQNLPCINVSNVFIATLYYLCIPPGSQHSTYCTVSQAYCFSSWLCPGLGKYKL